MGRSLSADDGALRKRGRNYHYLAKRMQEGTGNVERWGIKWGFKVPSAKTKVMVFRSEQSKDVRECVGEGRELPFAWCLL